MTRRTLFLIGILFELVAVFGLFIPQEMILATGTPVTLRSVPVDPASIFRGEYVTLSYEAGAGLPENWPYDQPVFTVLEQKGDVYEKVAFSQVKPVLKPGQVCLAGSPAYHRANFPDIAQYFVQEGEGRQLEQARNAHHLLVDISVNANCRAVIRGLRIGSEVTDAELKQFQSDEGLTPVDAMPSDMPVKPVPSK